MKLSPRVQEYIKKYACFAWWGACGAGVLLCLVLVLVYFFSGSGETENAVEDGRRLVIALKSGEVTGKVITLDSLQPKKTEEKTEPADEGEKKETEKSEAEKPPEEPPSADTIDDKKEEQKTEPSAEEKKPEASSNVPMGGANPELIEKTEAGDLPVIGSDGTKPWRFYSKPFERKRNQPMVAIIISGLGQIRTTTEDALKLHEYFTVSFSPYVQDVFSWNAAARASGHEMLVDLPLQPTTYPAADPGPHGLLLEKGQSDVEKHLQWLMARFPTSMGFLTPQSDAFTSNEEAFRFLMQSLANRGLLLVMGHEPLKKESREQIDASQKTIVIGDLLLDEDLSASSIQSRLSQLEDLAKKHGYAIGIAQPYPITIEQLRLWSEALAEKNVILVPVSAIAKLRFS